MSRVGNNRNYSCWEKGNNFGSNNRITNSRRDEWMNTGNQRENQSLKQTVATMEQGQGPEQEQWQKAVKYKGHFKVKLQ